MIGERGAAFHQIDRQAAAFEIDDGVGQHCFGRAFRLPGQAQGDGAQAFLTIAFQAAVHRFDRAGEGVFKLVLHKARFRAEVFEHILCGRLEALETSGEVPAQQYFYKQNIIEPTQQLPRALGEGIALVGGQVEVAVQGGVPKTGVGQYVGKKEDARDQAQA